MITRSTTFALFVALLANAGCSSPADTPSSPVPPSGAPADGGSDRVAPPVGDSIAGFDLQVKEGSWWEYSWVYDDSYTFDTGTGSDHKEATFVLMLGAATTIAGEKAFPVSEMVLKSACTSNPGNCTPDTVGVWQPWGWRYLSFVGKRIRGSKDGQTFSVLFDANTGIWPATSNGMFGDFPSDTGERQATRGPGPGTVWLVQEHNSANGCDDIPGYGVVCSSGGTSSNGAMEKWDPAIGCIGSSYSASGYNNSGSAQNSSATKLVDSSVTGNRRAPQPPSDGGTPAGNDAGTQCPAAPGGGVCDVFPACGCTATQNCVRNSSGPEECVQAGNVALGGTCSQVTDCAVGLQCSDDVCKAPCAGSCSSAVDVCLPQYASNTSLGYSVCTPHCDPVQPPTGDATHAACSPGQGCALLEDAAGDTYCFAPAGTGVQGSTCSSDYDCAAGYGCVTPQSSGSVCEHYCRVGVAGDCATGSCTSFSTALYDGTQEIGACQ